MTSKLATLSELQTVYGLRDMWDLIEIAAVQAHNEWAAVEEAERESRKK